MNPIKISLSKKIKEDTTHRKSIEVVLSVIAAENITKNIFVSIFHPQSSYYGDSFYEFSNVAYYDELTNIKDYVEDTRIQCEVRRPCAQATFSNYSDLNKWLSVVYSDIQRLITQIKTINSVSSTLVDITDESIIESSDIVSEPSIEDIVKSANVDNMVYMAEEENTNVVTLSFDGK